jgi:hypothetical protein
VESAERRLAIEPDRPWQSAPACSSIDVVVRDSAHLLTAKKIA